MLSSPDLSRRLRVARGDAFLNQLLDEYIATPKILNDVMFSRTLASELGVQGFVHEAITLNLRVLNKIKGRSSDVHIDLAVMYGQLGDEMKKRHHFDLIPKAHRNGTAYGNLLRDFGFFDEAIACFERACRQDEAKLYLTFSNLAFMYPFGSQERTFWLEQGYNAHPHEIGIIHPLAFHRFAEGNWQGVLDIQVDQINLTHVPGVIRSSPIASQIHDVRQLQKLSFGMFESSEQTVLEHGDVVCDLGAPYGCEPIKGLLGQLMSRGMLESVMKFYPKLCSECTESIRFPSLILETAIATGDQQKLRDTYENFASDIIPMMQLSYVSALDDFGNTSESLEILAEQLFFEDLDDAIRLRAQYDGFFYSLQLGRALLARELISEVCNVDQEAVISLYSDKPDGIKTVPHGYYDELLTWRDLNRVIAEVFSHEFELAKMHLKELFSVSISSPSPEEHFSRVIAGPTNVQISMSSEFREWLSLFVAWAPDRASSARFSAEIANYVANGAQKFGLPSLGVLIPSESAPSFSVAALVGGKNRFSSLANWRLQAAVNREKGDITHLISSLRSHIPAVTTLSRSALTSLVSAEERYLAKDHSFDPGATIHSYCKSVEIHLREDLFQDLRDYISGLGNFSVLIDDARTSKKFPQLASVIRFLEGGFAELGVMIRCIRLARGKSRQSIQLFAEINKWLQSYASFVFDSGFLESLDRLTTEYRNPSAHEASLCFADLESARSLTFEVLFEMTRPRLHVLNQPHIAEEL